MQNEDTKICKIIAGYKNILKNHLIDIQTKNAFKFVNLQTYQKMKRIAITYNIKEAPR